MNPVASDLKVVEEVEKGRTEQDCSSCDSPTAPGTFGADQSLESDSWETNTECGFESEDEFENGAPSQWVSECASSSSGGTPSQVKQEAPKPSNQMFGCYVMGQAMQPMQGGMPWGANVAFLPVLMMPAVAAPTSQ
eukprot:6282079-Amphidinium_carterae.1